MRLNLSRRAVVLLALSSLTFAVQAGAPGFVPSTSPLDCGTTFIGGLMHNHALTIKNNGTAPLNISSVTLVGSEFAFPGGSPPTLAQVPAGSSSLSLDLIFTPTGAGTRTGQMIIQDDAPGSPHTIPLTGFGVNVAAGDFAILAPNNAPISATVTAGQTATYHLAATGGPNNVALQCTGAPTGAACNVQPSVGLTGGSILGSDSTEPVMVTVSTTGRAAALRTPHRAPWWAFALSIAIIGLVGCRIGARGLILAACAIFVIAGMASCGGGGSSGNANGPTPAGTFTLTLKATGNGGTTHNVPITLVVQ